MGVLFDYKEGSGVKCMQQTLKSGDQCPDIFAGIASLTNSVEVIITAFDPVEITPLVNVRVPSTIKLLPLTITPLELLIVIFSTLFPAGVIV